MDYTPNLELPLILSGQKQKHILYNEAIHILDTLFQLSVKSTDLSTPPTDPEDGDRYIISDQPDGDWTGKAHHIAVFSEGLWTYYMPEPGWISFVETTSTFVYWNAGVWTTLVNVAEGTAEIDIDQLSLLGINMEASMANRLSVTSENTLLTSEADSHRLYINKATSTGTSSTIFQSQFLGHAELGLMGDNTFRLKVSPDSQNWLDALIVDPMTAEVTLPHTSFNIEPIVSSIAIASDNLLTNGDFVINQRVHEGSDLDSGVYGHDRWRSGSMGASYSRSNGLVTLSSGTLEQVIELDWFNLTETAQFTVWVDALSGGSIDVTFGGTTVSIPEGSSFASITTSVPVNGDQLFSISPTGTAVSFKSIGLFRGEISSIYGQMSTNENYQRCLRYFQKSFPEAVKPASGLDAVENIATYYASKKLRTGAVLFHTPMRAAPVLDFFSSSRVSDLSNLWSNLMANGIYYECVSTTAYSVTDRAFSVDMDTIHNPGGYKALAVSGNWTASAEF